MTRPCIITAAITGALPRKTQTPAVPVTPSEQTGSTHVAYEAGCSLVRIHVRNKTESPSSSNGQLVVRIHDIRGEFGRHAATPEEARGNLMLAPA